MSEQAYTELLSAFCEHVQAANSADILEHGNLHIGEVAFTLVHDDSLGRDDILIYCDFGPLPQDDPAGNTWACCTPICSSTADRSAAASPSIRSPATSCCWPINAWPTRRRNGSRPTFASWPSWR